MHHSRQNMLDNRFTTVRELVELLATCDPDAPVATWCGGCCERRDCCANYNGVRIVAREEGGKPICYEIDDGWGRLVHHRWHPEKPT